MKIQRKGFSRARRRKVDLKKWPTKVDPVYKSKEQYKNCWRTMSRELSALQQLLYASNRYAVLLIFQAWMRPERTAPSGT